MSEPVIKRSFSVNGEIYDIPNNEVDGFLQSKPDAKEVKSYSVGNDIYDIPISDTAGFLKYRPDAKPLYDFNTNQQPNSTTIQNPDVNAILNEVVKQSAPGTERMKNLISGIQPARDIVTENKKEQSLAYIANQKKAISDKMDIAPLSENRALDWAIKNFPIGIMQSEKDKDYGRALDNLKKTEKLIKMDPKNGFKSFFQGGANPMLMDISTAGLKEITDQINKAGITIKANKGGQLSEHEQALLDTEGFLTAIQKGTEMPMTAEVGSAITQMIPYLIQFGLTGGANTATKGFVDGLIKTAESKGLSKILKQTASYSVGAAAQAASMPMLEGEIARRAGGTYSINSETGKGELIPGSAESFPKAAIKGFVNTWAEVAGENLGGIASDGMLKWGKKIASNPIKASAIEKGFYKTVNSVFGESGSQIPGFSKLIPEMLEEEATGVIQSANDGDWSFFTLKPQLTTLFSIVGMSGISKGMNIPRDIRGKRVEKEFTTADKELSQLPEDIQYSIRMLNHESNPEIIAKGLSTLWNKGMIKEEQRPIILNYVKAAAQKNVFDGFVEGKNIYEVAQNNLSNNLDKQYLPYVNQEEGKVQQGILYIPESSEPIPIHVINRAGETMSNVRMPDGSAKMVSNSQFKIENEFDYNEFKQTQIETAFNEMYVSEKAQEDEIKAEETAKTESNNISQSLIGKPFTLDGVDYTVGESNADGMVLIPADGVSEPRILNIDEAGQLIGKGLETEQTKAQTKTFPVNVADQQFEAVQTENGFILNHETFNKKEADKIAKQLNDKYDGRFTAEVMGEPVDPRNPLTDFNYTIHLRNVPTNEQNIQGQQVQAYPLQQEEHAVVQENVQPQGIQEPAPRIEAEIRTLENIEKTLKQNGYKTARMEDFHNEFHADESPEQVAKEIIEDIDSGQYSISSFPVFRNKGHLAIIQENIKQNRENGTPLFTETQAAIKYFTNAVKERIIDSPSGGKMGMNMFEENIIVNRLKNNPDKTIQSIEDIYGEVFENDKEFDTFIDNLSDHGIYKLYNYGKNNGRKEGNVDKSPTKENRQEQGIDKTAAEAAPKVEKKVVTKPIKETPIKRRLRNLVNLGVPRSFEEEVLYLIANGAKFDKNQFEGLTGLTKPKDQIKYAKRITKDGGIKFDVVQEQFEHDSNKKEAMDGAMDVPNAVIEILHKYTSQNQALTRLEELTRIDANQGLSDEQIKELEAQMALEEKETEVIKTDIDKKLQEVENKTNSDPYSWMDEPAGDMGQIEDPFNSEVSFLPDFKSLNTNIDEKDKRAEDVDNRQEDKRDSGSQGNIEVGSSENTPVVSEKTTDENPEITALKQRVVEIREEIKKAVNAKNKALLDVDKRNGLFGDTKADDKDPFKNTFQVTQATLDKVKKPFDDKITSLKREMADIEKTIETGIIESKGQKEIEIPKETREQLEDRLSEERKQRILREGTGNDEEFGLIPPKDIKSVDNIISNIDKILTALKTNEGNGKYKDFEGFSYGGKYSKNGGEQVREYMIALDVLPRELLESFYKKIGVRTYEDISKWAEKRYKDLQAKAEQPSKSNDDGLPKSTFVNNGITYKVGINQQGLIYIGSKLESGKWWYRFPNESEYDDIKLFIDNLSEEDKKLFRDYVDQFYRLYDKYKKEIESQKEQPKESEPQLTDLEKDVWKNVLSRGEGLMVRTRKEGETDYKNLLDNRLVEFGGWGGNATGKNVSLRLTEKGKELVKKQKSEQPSVETVKKPEAASENKQETPQTVQDLLNEMQAKMEQVEKPKYTLQFVSAKDLISSENPTANKLTQDKILEKYKEFTLLKKCLHG